MGPIDFSVTATDFISSCLNCSFFNSRRESFRSVVVACLRLQFMLLKSSCLNCSLLSSPGECFIPVEVGCNKLLCKSSCHVKVVVLIAVTLKP